MGKACGRTAATVGVLVAFALAACGGRAAEFYKPFRLIRQPFEASHREKPGTGKDSAIEQLANEIDWLEHHLDAFGTVVAKHPDVWGESRLTRHRAEYERQMAAKLDAFEVKFQGSLQRSDQAFLAWALSLQAAAGRGPSPSVPGPTDVSTVNTMITSAGQTSTSADVIKRKDPFQMADAPKMLVGFPNAQLAIEPTIELDQLSRYLNHLHELRRINEGDDTGDSPGYALNLVRIPVSVLPGKKTREGYGAEITVTATPYLSRDLLPATFRNLVINDLVDELAPPLTHWVNDPTTRELAEDMLAAAQHLRKSQSAEQQTRHEYLEKKSPLEQRKPSGDQDQDKGALDKLLKSYEKTQAARKEAQKAFDDSAERLRDHAEKHLRGIPGALGTKSRRARLPVPPSQVPDVFGDLSVALLISETHKALSIHPVNRKIIHLMDVRGFLTEELDAAYSFLSTANRRMVWNSCCGANLAYAIRERRVRDVESTRNAYLGCIDINRAERSAPPGARLQLLMGPQTAPPVPEAAPGPPGADAESREDYAVWATLTASLGWAILVESSLLNEQLNQDVAEAATAKGCPCPPGQWTPFFGPDPPDTARQAFVEYVKCRWPIRVFALDPVTQDQNIADAFARRRELQIAMALAFAGGRMNAQTMLRYTRRLEWDMATIALNRTAVGFSHGADTFGWRFYPRFQTPPIQGNATTLWETIAGGPTADQDLRKRQLEPGMRECVAIVVMPSFVPYVTFDTRTNWFKLTDPKCTELSLRETMVLSRSIKAMQNSAAQCAQCAHLYRDGEVDRLLRRVGQLDRELPIQTMQVQIPYENSAGGFELFNRGVTDLEPELIGWYGCAAIDPRGGDTLFLMGDGFSVLDARMIVGGRPAEFRLLSRQVMEVLVPSGVQSLTDRDGMPVVDVHLATPYGVSSHLLVPLAKPGAAPVDTLSVNFKGEGPIKFLYRAEQAKDGVWTIPGHVVRLPQPPELVITTTRLSAYPNAINVALQLCDDERRIRIPLKVVSFKLDTRTGEYFLTGKPLNDLADDLWTIVDSQVNPPPRTSRPISSRVFQVRGDIIVVDAAPIPINRAFVVKAEWDAQ